MNNKETLTYETLKNIRDELIKISEEMRNELTETESIIRSFEGEGIFQTDIASKTVSESYNEFAKSFTPFIEKLNEYSDFLTRQLNPAYNAMDSELASKWQSVAEAFRNAALPS